MLTELGLVLSLSLASLGFSGLLARWTLSGVPAGTEARRLVNAAARASEAFMLRVAKLSAAATAVALLLVGACHGASTFRGLPSGLALTAWSALAVVAGWILTLGVGYLATQVGLRATLRMLRATQVSLDHAASVGLRAAGVVALTGEALGTFAATGLFGLLYLLGGGGGAIPPEQAVALMERAEKALPGLGVGGAMAALVIGLSGATYHVSADAGALSASGLEPGDARNPAMVADLVGDQVGLGARRAADAMVSSLLGTVAVVLLGIAALRAHGAESGDRAWALVSLPLVVRGLGTAASLFGVMAARTHEAERPLAALFRGQLTAALLVLCGVAGAAAWLVNGPSWPWLVAAGAAGVVAGIGVSVAARRRVDRRLHPVQELLDAARTGHPVALVRGVAHGLQSALAPIALVGGALTLAHYFGERSGIPGGAILATATALSSLVSAGAYTVAVGLFGPIAAGTLTISALDPETHRAEVRRRAVLLDEAGFEGATAAESVMIVIGCASALVAGLGIPLLGSSVPALPTLALSHPPVLWAGLLGAAAVLSHTGRGLRRATIAAKGAVVEVERQLRAFPRDGGTVQVPDGYTPSYRALVELSARSATHGVIAPAVAGLLVPVALGIALRLLYTSPGLATEGLTSFVVIGSATGLGAALATDGSRAVLGAAYRASRPRGSSAGFDASLSGHAFGSFVGDLAAPSAHLFAKTAVLVALLVAPLIA